MHQQSRHTPDQPALPLRQHRHTPIAARDAAHQVEQLNPTGVAARDGGSSAAASMPPECPSFDNLVSSQDVLLGRTTTVDAMNRTPRRTPLFLVAPLAALATLAACGSDEPAANSSDQTAENADEPATEEPTVDDPTTTDHDDEPTAPQPAATDDEPETAEVADDAAPDPETDLADVSDDGGLDAQGQPVASPTITDAAGSTSEYLGSYVLENEEFGTMVTVTVDSSTRTIETNALPDHETGEFPNSGNPNAISEQDLTWEFPIEPTFTGTATEARTPGVGVNGVKLEPATAETVTCASGETFRVEALQEDFDLGLDFNNAHVQPTGEYHYHGTSELLVEAYATDGDLVHVGFAADGYLIYYSKSGAYTSGYELSTEERSGVGCTGSGALGGATVDIDGTDPDGTYTSDWVFTGAGHLDECNGVTIDGQYAYIMTDEYPYISRCLMGEFTETAPSDPPPGSPPPGGRGG